MRCAMDGRLVIWVRCLPRRLSLEFCAPLSQQAEFEPLEENNPLDLVALFDLDDAAFRERFRHTPLWRPKRRGLLRNAAIALGNRVWPGAMPALCRGLNDQEPLVSGASAWALGQYGVGEARHALEARRLIEADSQVRDEIDLALPAGD